MIRPIKDIHKSLRDNILHTFLTAHTEIGEYIKNNYDKIDCKELIDVIDLQTELISALEMDNKCYEKTV